MNVLLEIRDQGSEKNAGFNEVRCLMRLQSDMAEHMLSPGKNATGDELRLFSEKYQQWVEQVRDTTVPAGMHDDVQILLKGLRELDMAGAVVRYITNAIHADVATPTFTDEARNLRFLLPAVVQPLIADMKSGKSYRTQDQNVVLAMCAVP